VYPTDIVDAAYYLDVTDSKSIMDFFSKISPDIVVHLA
jgi:dTDP-4-dehydrorhamnose reductase